MLSAIFYQILILSLMGSVLTGLILLVKALARTKFSPKWHYYIWVLLLIRLAVPFTPPHEFSVFNLFTPIMAQVEWEGKPLEMIPANIEALQQNFEATLRNNPQLTQANLQAASSHGIGFMPVSLLDWIALIWTSGVAFMVMILFLSNRKFMRRHTVSLSLRGPKVIKIYYQCKEMLGIRRDIPILVSSAISSPLLFGLTRPKLLIPLSLLDTVTEDEMRYIFLHELIHYKRKDILVNWISALVKCVYWFNPVIWLACGRIKTDCEISCDESVLKVLNPPEYKRYGETILRLANTLLDPVNEACTSGIIGHKSTLKRRIRMIAGFKKRALVWSVLALVFTVLVGCTAMTGAKEGPRTDKEDPIVQQETAKPEKPTPMPSPEEEGVPTLPPEEDNATPTPATLTDAAGQIIADPNLPIDEQVDFYMDKLKDQSYTGTYGDGYTWYTAAEELGKIGKPAIPKLINRLATKDDYERSLAIYALLLATQHENVQSFAKGDYINVNLDFNAASHPEMIKTAMTWWDKYKSKF